MVRFLKKYTVPICIFIMFLMIGIFFSIFRKHVFYIINFSYIGFFVALTVGLMIAGKKQARILSEFAVGIYMFVFLGILNQENMQLEGFFYYAAMGIFQAAVIHYAVAKIGGPFIFGRAWCGYACWTAMILDILPYKTPRKPRNEKLGVFRWVIFLVTLAYFCIVWFLFRDSIHYLMYISFIAGNIFYYASGITLAFIFKDNRAFCKYLCPVTIILKPASYFSLLRIQCSKDDCINCGKCLKGCPMNVDMLDNKRSRKNGTECIQCLKCVQDCPKKALSWRIGSAYRFRNKRRNLGNRR